MIAQGGKKAATAVTIESVLRTGWVGVNVDVPLK